MIGRPYKLNPARYTEKHFVVDLIFHPARDWGPLMRAPDVARTAEAEDLAFAIRAAAQKAAEIFEIREPPARGCVITGSPWDMLPDRKKRAAIKYVIQELSPGPPWGNAKPTREELHRVEQALELLLPGSTSVRAA